MISSAPPPQEDIPRDSPPLKEPTKEMGTSLLNVTENIFLLMDHTMLMLLGAT
jgi:hypothetical protein